MKVFYYIKLAFVLFCGMVAFAGCKKEPQPVEPPVEPPHEVVEDVYGRVTDLEGKPVVGALVSDGFSFARTDSNGEYCINSKNPERVRFATVSYSSEYAPIVKDGVPVFYTMVEPYAERARKADIVLRKLDTPQTDFSIIMTADPQIKPLEIWTESLAYASRHTCEDLFEDIQASVEAISGKCIGICLGDIANNNPVIYPQYCNCMRQLDIPFFNVIGNHDHIYPEQVNDDGCASQFENIFGPRNYSFNMGDFHIICMDDCIFEAQPSGYCEQVIIYGLEDDFLSWLKEDLSNIDKSTPIMICMHAPLTKLDGTPQTASNYRNVKAFFECFSGYEKVYGWFGHSHWSQSSLSIKSVTGVEGFECHTIARTTGILPTNEYTCCDGNPRGYAILKVSGKELKWKFHANPIQRSKFMGPVAPEYKWRDWDYKDGVAMLKDGSGKVDESYQIRAYERGAYGDDYVYANVFMWDEKWGKAYLNVGGQKIEMTRDCGYDLGYKEIAKFYWAQGVDPSTGLSEYSSTNRQHFFYAPVPEGASGKATVEITDRFGEIFTRTVSVDPIQYEEDMKYLVFNFTQCPQGCPETDKKNVTFTMPFEGKDYSFTLSNGYHETAGYLAITRTNATLTLPVLEGYKLEQVVCRPADNAFASMSAKIILDDKTVPTGGDKLTFCGNSADSWNLELMESGTQYLFCSGTDFFSLGEIRLGFRKEKPTIVDGTSDQFVIEDGSDIVF